MRFQDHMIDVTKAAAEEAFRYAKAVPIDKVDWKPLDAGRSVLNLCQEMAMCATWAAEIISSVGKPAEGNEWDEASQAEQQKLMEGWSTVEACEQECKQRMDTLFEIFKALPDEKLKETKWLPYDGGRDFTVAEMMDYPRWNYNYHLGQISYIQTLYGDKDMH
ncbi:MAG: hypothetical protein HONBIEJF_00872 [Fimbriimonadaceae bacterium]|nr:hypothetical protein [Fimbriimonadaceae bacterium]